MVEAWNELNKSGDDGERCETPTEDDGFPTSSPCSASSPACSSEGTAPPRCDDDDAYDFELPRAANAPRRRSGSGGSGSGSAGNGGVGGAGGKHGGNGGKANANANAGSSRSDSRSKGSSSNGSKSGGKDRPPRPVGNTINWGTPAAPKLHLYEGIAGLFEDNEHSIGRSYTEAAGLLPGDSRCGNRGHRAFND